MSNKYIHTLLYKSDIKSVIKIKIKIKMNESL